MGAQCHLLDCPAHTTRPERGTQTKTLFGCRDTLFRRYILNCMGKWFKCRSLVFQAITEVDQRNTLASMLKNFCHDISLLNRYTTMKCTLFDFPKLLLRYHKL